MTELAHKLRSAWEVYNTPEERKAMHELAKDYIEFLTTCKTEREVIAYVQNKLRGIGFDEGIGEKGGFLTLYGKALFGVRKGKRPLSEGMRLISAHADSPRLDFKQRPLQEQVNVGQAKTHYYGGIRKYQWFARPLALHGVIVQSDGNKIPVVMGEKPGEAVFTIADLLPHLAHDMAGKKLSEAFDAEKLNVVMGHEPLLSDKDDKEESKDQVKAQMLEQLNRRFGICEDDLMSAELQAVPAGPASFVGLDEGLVGGYGQDDSICVYTALQAFLAVEEPEYTTCVIFWDKEEIGSDGATGASSRFFEYCIQDMIDAWEPKTPFRKVMLAARALSGDVHAALDPDWQELHEKQNSALIGDGPCFCKFTGSRGKYGANDANPEYIGWLRAILDKKNVPWQMAELGKVDVGGGGTVALFLATYGMSVIDLGPAILGMHSPFELASVADVYSTKLAYQTFYEN